MTILLVLLAVIECAISGGSQNFVTRSGTRLMLNGSVFRFSGANVTCDSDALTLKERIFTGLDENVDGIQYPSIFRISDALETAKGILI